jgi:hypothetical protein
MDEKKVAEPVKAEGTLQRVGSEIFAELHKINRDIDEHVKTVLQIFGPDLVAFANKLKSQGAPLLESNLSEMRNWAQGKIEYVADEVKKDASLKGLNGIQMLGRAAELFFADLQNGAIPAIGAEAKNLTMGDATTITQLAYNFFSVLPK